MKQYIYELKLALARLDRRHIQLASILFSLAMVGFFPQSPGAGGDVSG